ncbi:MAG: TrbG/VirB9 family P-type conjugative transfer protein, partial [Casimicrobiaceae bacterium]
MIAPHGAVSRMAVLSMLIAGLLLVAGPAAADNPSAAGTDPRLHEISYDPQRVVTVPVKRGQVTLVLLDADESIMELAAGLGGDCSKADSAWCIAAQPSGRTVFVKPKSTATAANNLAIVT